MRTRSESIGREHRRALATGRTVGRAVVAVLVVLLATAVFAGRAVSRATSFGVIAPVFACVGAVAMASVRRVRPVRVSRRRERGLFALEPRAARALPDRFEVIAHAGRVFAERPAGDALLAELNAVFVPALADVAGVVKRSADGSLSLVAVATREGLAAPHWHERLASELRRVDSAHVIARALHGGRCERGVDTPDGPLRGAARPFPWRERVAWLIAPIASGTTVHGAFVLLSFRRWRAPDPLDAVVAHDLAQHAGDVLASAARASVVPGRSPTEYLSVAAHELKSPLAALRLQAELLVRASDRGRDVRTTASAIERTTRRLTRLVDDMLDASRAASGRLVLQREPTDLAALVREVLARAETRMSDGGSECTVSCEAAVHGEWDRARLDQVVTNLVGNAFKYGRGRPVRVHVEADPGGTWARLVVRDEGIGIAAADLDRIFRPFERAANVGSTPGLGIGLHVVRGIVEAHGGRVTVESVAGEGSTFVAWLPRA